MMHTAVGNTALRGLRASRGLGLFSRIGNSLNAIKALNWGGIINNTSKTLGIINQTIPIVKQVGPMMNNMKSMLKIASIFKDETDVPKKKNYFTNNYQTKIQNNSNSSTTIQKNNIKNYYQDTEDYSPTFFIA